jgi:hypothetical protein
MVLWRAGKYDPPVTPLLNRAVRLGREWSLTFYHASCLALAVELDGPFVTADQRLFDHTRTLARVRHLSRIGRIARSGSNIRRFSGCASVGGTSENGVPVSIVHLQALEGD